jgi:hypothetical protein
MMIHLKRHDYVYLVIFQRDDDTDMINAVFRRL